MSAPDLTRWNRAGLRRLRYVDANAAVYYELLRTALHSRFSHWPAAAPVQENPDQRRDRLTRQYAEGRGDWGEELARSLARASHVLTEYLDAYANEATLRTATQWDNLRRLVEMLNYHPAPPASAATPLIVTAKRDKRGRVARGFAVRYAPIDGGAPVIFETLADLEVDEKLNVLHLTGHDRSPQPLVGTTLTLAEAVAGLKLGDPVVLESESRSFTIARLIAGIRDQDGRTVLTLNGPVGAGAGFTHGDTVVHVRPVERLAALAPVQTDAAPGTLGDRLMLAVEPRTLGVGDVVYISDGRNGYFRRVTAIAGKWLRFDTALDGALRLDQAFVSRARQVSVAKVDGRTTEEGVTLFSFKAAGDLSAYGPPARLADVVAPGGTPQLVEFEIKSAKYQPLDPDNRPGGGYTAFTIADPGLVLNNPQAVFLPAVTRDWTVDSYLHDPAGGLLPLTLTTSLPKAASAGDLAVVVSGERLGWARIENIVPDTEAGRAELSVQRWYTRASGKFYRSDTRVYSRFKQQVRTDGWNRNDTAVSGQRLPLAEAARPDLLVIGRRLWIEQGRSPGFAHGREATVVDLTASELVIAPELASADGFTFGNTVIRGNVVSAGHGETQSERILGSGDAAMLNQSFVLELAGVSFVADATQPAGVRADLDAIVDGQRWQQAGTLDDAGPGDACYTVHMTEAGFVKIGFGDGVRGRRLPSGTNNVRVRYRLGTGLAGNLPAGRLEKPARPHPLVDKLRHPVAAVGGGDMESTDALRRNAPASVLTLERAVSAADYAHLAAAHAAIWRARAFRMPSALRRARIEVVVVPAGGGALGTVGATIEGFLAAHSQPGVQVVVREFERVRLYLDVRLRVVSAEFDPQRIKAEAIRRLQAAFTLEQRDIGVPLHLSDVYAVVETIAGVRNSSCRLASRRGDPPVQPAGQRIAAGPREVVFLDPADPAALRVECEEFAL